MSVGDARSLFVADAGGVVAAGSIQTIGSEVPLPVDASSGTRVALTVPISTAVAAGKQHACAISTERVYCWGDHTNGALGAHRVCTSRATEEMPDAPPDCILNGEVMPTLPAVRAVAAGDDVTCATAVTDDRVYCWGTASLTGGSHVPALDPPSAVQLPDGSPLRARQLTIRNQTICAIDHAQTAWCWGETFGERPQRLELTGVRDLAIGTDHSCAIAANGLTCWGSNRNGQIGDFDHAHRCGNACRLGPTAINLDAIRVVVGERHSCALLASGAVACWGSNEIGQLGRDDAFLVGAIANVVGVAAAVDLASSYARSCALAADGTAICWGEHVSSY